MRIGTRREPGLVLLFSILTCGIYYYWWVYKVSGEVQDFLGEPDTAPATELLLSALTCGLYLFYWDWKIAEKIARMQERVNIPPKDNTVLYLVLNLLGAGPAYGLGLLVPLIEQSHLNEIWDAARGRVMG
jgi:hypothetical protein